jgi:hypothetical protein
MPSLPVYCNQWINGFSFFLALADIPLDSSEHVALYAPSHLSMIQHCRFQVRVEIQDTILISYMEIELRSCESLILCRK